MNSDQITALTSRAVMAALGDDATYMPLIGSVRTVRVFQRRPQRVIEGLGVSRLVNDGCIIEIERASLSVDPQPGDKLRIGNRVLIVKSACPSGASTVAWELNCDAS